MNLPPPPSTPFPLLPSAFLEEDHSHYLTFLLAPDMPPAKRTKICVEDQHSSDNDSDRSGAATSSHSPPPRRLWVRDRSRAWWDECNSPDFPEPDFRATFRMSRATFEFICNQLGSAVGKADTVLRAAVPVRQRVAVCLYRLATGEPLRLVSKRFGLGISTCHKLVLEVCAAIRTVLMPVFLHWPAETLKLSGQFQELAGIPGVMGAVYTSHVAIVAPKVSAAAYLNSRQTSRNNKTCYSVTIQGVVDPNGVFTDVCIGVPGSLSDDQVLERSGLFQRAAAGEFSKNSWIVGGAGYSLMDWMMVPYTHENLTWTQHMFNDKVGRVQQVAKEAFARLKGRWGCLQSRTEVKLQELPVVLGACCVLHNICEMRKEEMGPEMWYELADDEMVAENGVRSASAMQARDAVAHNLLHGGFAGTSYL